MLYHLRTQRFHYLKHLRRWLPQGPYQWWLKCICCWCGTFTGGKPVCAACNAVITGPDVVFVDGDDGYA